MNNKISKIGMLSALALSCTLTMGARDIVQRTAHYMPEGNAFVCVNGSSRIPVLSMAVRLNGG